MAGVIFDGNTVAPAILIEKEITKTKFGVGFDGWVGVLDEDGVLGLQSEPFEINAAGVKVVVADYIFAYKMYGQKSLKSVKFHDLETISGSNTFSNAFSCSGVNLIVLHNLTEISGYDGCNRMFYCCEVTDTNLKKLTTISGGYGAEYMFAYCSKLIGTGLESLTTISGAYGCRNMFSYCRALTKEYFPMLTIVTQKNALGTSSSDGMFAYCTKLTELHFRADAQAVIEGLTGYSAKFGATNATIYFDLIGTITVNGVAYARDEKQSIRVDGVKTFVGWKDADGNVVYTSYADNAEPAVGTVAYSDAGTTQVGTVEGVA